jgi:hypothetical protein
MLGGKELAQLDLQKQALLAESGLNRVALEAEIQHLHSATAWVTDLSNPSRGLTLLLAALTPVVGFLLARGSRRSDSWLGRMLELAKWMPPLYRLWKSVSSRMREPEADKPAA